MIPLSYTYKLPTVAPHFAHLPRASSLHYYPHLFRTCPHPILSPPHATSTHLHNRRISAMPIGESPTHLRQSPPEALPFELKDESDFDQIVTPDGLVSVCGFGSLLSGSCDQSIPSIT